MKKLFFLSAGIMALAMSNGIMPVEKKSHQKRGLSQTKRKSVLQSSMQANSMNMSLKV